MDQQFWLWFADFLNRVPFAMFVAVYVMIRLENAMHAVAVAEIEEVKILARLEKLLDMIEARGTIALTTRE